MTDARAHTTLDDDAARAEAHRLSRVALARWREHAAWMGFPAPDASQEQPNLFEANLLAIFRFARGEDVPESIVEDALERLLNLLFAGLASGALALPRFHKMRDRPWAHAWRLAEARLALASGEPLPLTELAHLLDVEPRALLTRLSEAGVELGPALLCPPEVVARALRDALPILS